jgi:hypothetical protein
VPRLRAGVIVGGTGRNVSQLMSCSVAILDWSLVAAQGRDNADLMHLLILDLRHGDDIERVIRSGKESVRKEKAVRRW